MDFNSKLNYFLKNGPPETVRNLNEILYQVNLFTKDNVICEEESTDNSLRTKSGMSCTSIDEVARPCPKVSNKTCCDLEANEENPFSKMYDRNCDHECVSFQEEKLPVSNEVNDGLESDSENTELNLANLRQPLKKGWKRETFINSIGKDFQIQGHVCYYAPGSRVELKNIDQIRTILEKQPSNLTICNFSFSTQPIVGTFLQQFTCSSDAKYYVKSEAQMAKSLNEYKRLRSNADMRKKNRSNSCNKKMDIDVNNKRDVDDQGSSTNDNSIGGDEAKIKDTIEESSSEKMQIDEKDEESTLEIRLFKVADSETFYDEKGYLYSKNNSKQVQNTYFRCKNSNRYGCRARAKATGNNFENTILTRKHNHLPRPDKVDKEKFDKQLAKECNENPLSYAREIYTKTRKRMKEIIDPLNIPLKGKYDTLIYRKKRKHMPKLPKTVTEFEELIQNYKEQYFYDERNLPFYRKIWKTKSGESNVVFISESVLNKMKEMQADKEVIQMLMDGTFKVVPRHIKFRQLYIISIIFDGRCYPLAFILMQTKSFYSYSLIFGKLKQLFPQCEVANFMTDYEAATRKALKFHFPLARISGCYFHYVKAINKATRRFGLSKDVKFETAIQKVSALALLPNEFVSDGFKIIEEENRLFKYSVRWGRFKKYWQRQWEEANISVYGLEHRTNNFAESMNKSLNVLTKVKGPNIWILIEQLKTLEMDKTDELNQHSKGVIIKTTKKGSDEINALNRMIKDATNEFNAKQNVAKFLRNVTCGDKLENYFKERIYLDGVDEYNPDEDSGFEDDEDFLPNDFNEKSNFGFQPKVRPSLKRKASPTNKQNCKKSRH